MTVLAPPAAVTVVAGPVTVMYETELDGLLPFDTVTVETEVVVTVEAGDVIVVCPAEPDAATVTVLVPPVVTVIVEVEVAVTVEAPVVTVFVPAGADTVTVTALAPPVEIVRVDQFVTVLVPPVLTVRVE